DTQSSVKPMVLQTVRQKLNGYFKSESDRLNQRHPMQRHRFNRWFGNFSYPLEQRLQNLVAYIYASPPAILLLLETRETPYTLKNTSKPTQVHIDQMLRFSTSFVS